MSGYITTIGDGKDVAQGATTDAEWVSGAGTVIALLKKIASGTGGGGGAVTIADGADVAEGATTDVAVQGDNPGTVSAKLRGLNKSIAAGIAVTGPLTDTQLRASAVPISAAALPLPTNAATEPTLLTVVADLEAINDTLGGIASDTGTLGTISGNTAPLVAPAAGGYIRQDSTATIAKESGGNLDAIRAQTDNLTSISDNELITATATSALSQTVLSLGNEGAQAVTVQGSVNAVSLPVRQDSDATIARETGGNLATLVMQTVPLVTAQGAVASGALGPLVQGKVSDGLESYESDTIQPISLTPRGRVRVVVVPEYDLEWNLTSPWLDSSPAWGHQVRES